jgi:hypothetical protein
MNRMASKAAVVILMAVFAGAPLGAQSGTSVTGAGGGLYPSGTSFSGVSLSGLKFGTGVTIATNGSAEGQFQATLLGTSVLGQPQNIQIEGKATAGSSAAAGTATFSGACTLDLGDGTLPSQNVPFIVAITTNADDQGTLALTIGLTSLPAATVNEGSMKIE